MPPPPFFLFYFFNFTIYYQPNFLSIIFVVHITPQFIFSEILFYTYLLFKFDPSPLHYVSLSRSPDLTHAVFSSLHMRALLLFLVCTCALLLSLLAKTFP